MRYIFSITISGYGNTAEEAWENAVEAFVEDPGISDELEYIEEEENDE